MASGPTKKAKEIGARIAQARNEAGGMTQAELAHLVSLSERSVQAHEAGEVIPYRFLREYERVLGKPAAWFLHGEAAVLGSSEEHRDLVERLEKLQRSVDAMARRLDRK